MKHRGDLRWPLLVSAVLATGCFSDADRGDLDAGASELDAPRDVASAPDRVDAADALDAADASAPRDAPRDRVGVRDATDVPDVVDVTTSRDAALDALGARDVTDAAAARDAGLPCASSARWTCAALLDRRQRCNGGVLETEACPSGCIASAAPAEDRCRLAPNATNEHDFCPPPGCLGWWNCPVTQTYQHTGTFQPNDWDTDFVVPDGTPIILHGDAYLTHVTIDSVAGFQPEFREVVGGRWLYFNHLHPNCEAGDNCAVHHADALGLLQLVSMNDPDHPHVPGTPGPRYPAHWVVGFSGGGTHATGFNGRTSAGACPGGFSNDAHFCTVTVDRPPGSRPNILVHPHDGACAASGWPALTLFFFANLLRPGQGYASCPSACTGCGVPHF